MRVTIPALLLLACLHAGAFASAPPAGGDPSQAGSPAQQPASGAAVSSSAPAQPPLVHELPVSDRAPEELQRRAQLPIVNGRLYDQQSTRDKFLYYVIDAYGIPASGRSLLRAAYNQGVGKPHGWGDDFAGFAQRFGSAEGVTAINASVRYGLGTLLHEDTRYLPCQRCSVHDKLVNAFLADFTERHGEEGRRVFSLTPIIADFSGPIIANSFWYPPGYGPLDGLVAVRVVLLTRIGTHLIREFVGDKHPRLNFSREDIEEERADREAALKLHQPAAPATLPKQP